MNKLSVTTIAIIYLYSTTKRQIKCTCMGTLQLVITHLLTLNMRDYFSEFKISDEFEFSHIFVT